MQTHTSFYDELKTMYRRSAFMKLIFINVAIFLVANILLVFADLSHAEGTIGYYISAVLAMPTDISQFIRQPWTLITSMFAHLGVLHLLLNMIMLFYIGRIFEQLYGSKKLVYTYFLGGLAGNIFELLAHLVFPALLGKYGAVMGASGAVMALFIMLAFSQPQLKVHLFFFAQVRIIWIALIYIVADFMRLGTDDGVAHFAHLGGAAIGLLAARNVHSSSNIIVVAQNAVDSIVNAFRPSKKTKIKVKRGRDVRQMTDEEYNADAKARQDEINRILDKISKSGYESLSKKEKDFLFSQSKNG